MDTLEIVWLISDIIFITAVITTAMDHYKIFKFKIKKKWLKDLLYIIVVIFGIISFVCEIIWTKNNSY